MSTSWSWITLVVALAFYVYLGWITPVARPDAPGEVAIVAGWTWAAAIGAAFFACVWAATRSVTLQQVLLGDEGYGAFWSFVGAARSLVVLALLFSVHAFVALVVRRTSGRGIGN